MAQVTIEGAALATGQESLGDGRNQAWRSKNVGYFFTVDSGNDLEYRKTTDGGATVGSPVSVEATDTVILFTIWADWWTPGDAGTKIHIWWADGATGDIVYRNLDTATDTLSTAVTVDAGGTSAGTNATSVMSGTKSRGGRLYIAFWIDAAADNTGFARSTDSGATWGARLTPFESVLDYISLLPGGAADNHDLQAIFWDLSADELSRKIHDDSANTWPTETSIATSMADTTKANVFPQIGASVRHSDNIAVVVAWSQFDNAAADLRCWFVSESTVTEKTNVVTNKSEEAGAAVLIDQNNNNIYVCWPGGTGTYTANVDIAGMYSTDGGATWGAPPTTFDFGLGLWNVFSDDYRGVTLDLGGKTTRVMPMHFDDDDNTWFGFNLAVEDIPIEVPPVLASAALAASSTIASVARFEHAAASALAGAATLDAAADVSGGGVTHNALAALTGAGSLAADAAAVYAAAGVMAAAGNVAGAVTLIRNVEAVLAGSGALAAAPGVIMPAASTFTGNAALAVAGMVTRRLEAAFLSSAALAGDATLSAAAAAALAGSGALSPAAVGAWAAVSALNGAGTLSPSAIMTLEALSGLSGAGSLLADASLQGIVEAVLGATGSITAPSTVYRMAEAQLSGLATMTALQLLTLGASSALNGAGSLTPAALVERNVIAALAGAGVMSPSAMILATAELALSGNAQLVALAQRLVYGEVVMLGAGDLAAVGYFEHMAAAVLTGSALIEPDVAGIKEAAALLSPSIILTPAALVRRNVVAALVARALMPGLEARITYENTEIGRAKLYRQQQRAREAWKAAQEAALTGDTAAVLASELAWSALVRWEGWDPPNAAREEYERAAEAALAGDDARVESSKLNWSALKRWAGWDPDRLTTGDED